MNKAAPKTKLNLLHSYVTNNTETNPKHHERADTRTVISVESRNREDSIRVINNHRLPDLNAHEQRLIKLQKSQSKIKTLTWKNEMGNCQKGRWTPEKIQNWKTNLWVVLEKEGFGEMGRVNWVREMGGDPNWVVFVGVG